MELLPFDPITITTPVGEKAEGKKLAATEVCGVSILGTGGPLEKGLSRVIHDVRLGTLLIQSDPATGEPMLMYSMLPCCVMDRERSKDTWVFLLDAQASIRIVIGNGQHDCSNLRTDRNRG